MFALFSQVFSHCFVHSDDDHVLRVLSLLFIMMVLSTVVRIGYPSLPSYVVLGISTNFGQWLSSFMSNKPDQISLFFVTKVLLLFLSIL